MGTAQIGLRIIPSPVVSKLDSLILLGTVSLLTYLNTFFLWLHWLYQVLLSVTKNPE